MRAGFTAPVSTGVRLSPELFEETPAGEGVFGAFSRDDQLLALIQSSGGALRYLAAFPEQAAGRPS